MRAPQDEDGRARAELRLVAEPFAVIPISRCQTAHRVPAAHFCVRGLQLRFTHPEIEGWAERRETFGCQRAPVGRAVSRHARRLRGALRPMTRDARLSALHRGGFGPRGRASVSLGARRPTTAGICLRIRAASSSQPGRSAWRAGSRASRGKRLQVARRRTPLPAPPSGCLRRRPSMSEDAKLCYIASRCSQ